jgi:hypothetical protein
MINNIIAALPDAFIALTMTAIIHRIAFGYWGNVKVLIIPAIIATVVMVH